MALFDFFKGKKKHAEAAPPDTPSSPVSGDSVDRFIGICCSTTGYFYHSFRNASTNEEVFSIGYLVMPEPNVSLSGLGKELHCPKTDFGVTLVPGSRRVVVDKSGSQYGIYEYDSENKMHLIIKGQKITVIRDVEGWTFFFDFAEVARITRLPDNERTANTENGFDTEKRFQAEVSKQIAVKWLPLILGTPLLGF